MKQHAWCVVRRYSGAWHVDFSFFSKNDDERKEECNFCLLLNEEVYDHIHSSECSKTEPLPYCILQEVYCISLKEAKQYDIRKSLSFLSVR